MEKSKKEKNQSGLLSFKEKFAYCGGGIGRDMAYNLINAQILTFLMLTRNLDDKMLAVITVIMICCKIFDGLNDPIMGTVIEYTHNKKGKFKPWILLGVCSNTIVIMSIYAVPLQGWSYVIFFGFAYLLWGLTFTMNDIAYWSMLPALSTDKKERDGLTSWANLLAGLGAGIAGAVAQPLTVGEFALTPSISKSYLIIAAIICAAFLGCQLMTYFGAPHKSTLQSEKEKTEEKQKRKNPLKELWQVIKQNDQLRVIAIVMFLYNIGATMLSVAMTYYTYLEYGLEGMLVTIFGLIFGVAGAIPMLSYGALSKKFTRKQMVLLSMMISVFGYALFMCVGTAFKTKAVFSIFGLEMKLDFILMALCGLFISVGQSLLYNVTTIGISNCIEYNDFRWGERKEGVIFSIRPLMAKIGNAFQTGILTLLYILLGINGFTNKISQIDNAVIRGSLTENMIQSLIDYGYSAAEIQSAQDSGIISDEIKNALVEMERSAVAGSNPGLKLKIIVCIIAVALIVGASIIMYKRFIISEDKYAEMVAEIEKRKPSPQNNGNEKEKANDSDSEKANENEESVDEDKFQQNEDKNEESSSDNKKPSKEDNEK